MNIFAISDLHLSGTPPTKPMEVFGENWAGHWEKICNDWHNRVQPQDVILLPGDISWGMNFAEAGEDLLAINELPGQKVLVKGNHDYWWATSAKLRENLPSSITFIHNSYHAVGDVALCGSRGWINPLDSMFTTQDGKIYEREKGRIAASIEAAIKDGYSRIILVTHYPMIYRDDVDGEYAKSLAEYGIEHYVYGHLHDGGIGLGPVGEFHDVQYHLVSCDALDFKLKKIATV
ncbi:hypothetical protein SDC9_09195 [bioreactor metagenome]|uniref:Calcineurin-like phosphoesterase domain-containing protein n=1 Tax=bioreactor metagenome TaxID=1076179 RepID=A0A644T9C9_9ZZZZ